MLIKNIFFALILLVFNLAFSCENEDQQTSKRTYSREELIQIKNQISDDPDYQAKVKEIKEQILKVFNNKNKSKKSNSPLEDQVANLEN